MSQKEKFVIIDGNALLHRAFHALPPLTTKDGTLVNAVYGFALTFFKVLKDLKPGYMAVAFDTRAPTFRDEMYEDYKAHRVKQPQELYDQIPLIKELVKAFHIPVIEKDGFEADDVIGTLVQKSKVKNIIVTGDLDALQLVDDDTEVYTFRKGFTETMIYDAAAVKERFGLEPSQIVDYKALRGDASDNIPGVKGIGEKTATALLQKFKTLENVYRLVENAGPPQPFRGVPAKSLHWRLCGPVGHSAQSSWPRGSRPLSRGGTGEIKPAVLEKLKKGKKEALLSQMLATIIVDMPLSFDMDDARVRPADAQTMIALFRHWGFKSLVSKIPSLTAGTDLDRSLPGQKQGTLDLVSHATPAATAKPNAREWKNVDYRLVASEEAFTSFFNELRKQKAFVVDTETTGLNPFKAHLLGMSFCWKAGEAWYVPHTQLITHPASMAGSRKPSDSSTTNVRDNKQLKGLLEDPKIEKYGHNVKYDLEVLRTNGINAHGFTFDTMIASYLLNPGSRQHNLDGVVFSEFGYQMQPIEELIGKGRQQRNMSEVPMADMANYSCEDADYTFRLVDPFIKELRQRKNLKLLSELEMPLVPILADMEEAGVKIDVDFLHNLSKKTQSQLKKLETKIYHAAGQTFNINSPQQLKEVLFEKLKLPTLGISKIKTGISTAAGELEKLKTAHPIIPLITQYRELFKLQTTYLEALPEQVDAETGRIHTDFNQTVAATGRLSSSNPNLQNIPIRTSLGREMRKGFVAERGYRLLSADYSQIELRIAASLTGDSAMTTSFHRGEDIHRRTASNVLGVPYDEVSEAQRRRAKMINFGILYGLGARGLAEGSGLSIEEARDFIERYFRIHTGIKAYVDRTIGEAREKGYVETLFGRRRYLPEITAEHQGLRAQAERMAINHPIQGTQADFIKKAMINVDKRLRHEFAIEEVDVGTRPVRMILQVHDELVFEVRADLVEKVSRIVKEEMEQVAKLTVPIEAHVGVGKNWGECK